MSFPVNLGEGMLPKLLTGLNVAQLGALPSGPV